MFFFKLLYWIIAVLFIPIVNLIRLPLWYVIECVEMFKKAKTKLDVIVLTQTTIKGVKEVFENFEELETISELDKDQEVIIDVD